MPSFSSCSAALMPGQVEAILIRMRSLEMPAFSYCSIISRATFIVASVPYDKRASTSVDTRPGTMARIFLPNATRQLLESLVGYVLVICVWAQFLFRLEQHVVHNGL